MKKSVVAAAVTAGVVLAGAGVFFAARYSGRKPVKVMPVQELNNGYYSDSTRMSAMISSDVAQNIYVLKNQKIQELYVHEGQTVKVGDPLISYDMTLANLNLEIEEMKQEGIRLRIKKAQQELELLKAGKVPPQTGIEGAGGLGSGGNQGADKDTARASALKGAAQAELLALESPEKPGEGTDQPGGPENPEKPGEGTDQPGGPENPEKPGEGTDQPGRPENPEKPGEGTDQPADGGPAYKDRIYRRLEYGSYPMSGKGTEEEPYIFVCQKDSVVVTGAFLNRMAGYPDSQENTAPEKEKDSQGNELKGYRFRIEARETYDGPAEKAWIGNGEKLPWIHWENVFVLENQEALEQLGKALRPEVSAEVLQAAVEAAVSLDITSYEPGEEMDAFLEALSQAQEVLEKVMNEESVLQTAIDGACRLLLEAQKKLMPVKDSGGGDVNGGDIIGGDVIGGDINVGDITGGDVDGGGSTDPSYTEEEIAKLRGEKEKELRQLNLDLRQADLNVRKLGADMKGQSVKSTINGVIKSVGDRENPTGNNGEPFIQVVSSEGLYVRGNLSELMLDQVQEGQLLYGYAYESGVSFQAEIREVSLYPVDGSSYWGGGNSNASYYPFIAYIEDASGLKNYESVELNVQAGMEGTLAAEGIYLSKAFIRSEDGIDYVMKDDGNGKLVRQEVQLGWVSYGDIYEVVSGLSNEDKIAFPYGKGVKEGAKTEVISSTEFWEEAYA